MTQRSPEAGPPAMPDRSADQGGTGRDVVLIHGRSDDGTLKVLRKKGDELSAGELRPLEEGKPIAGDILRLKPRPELPLLCDVQEEITIPRRTAGPSQVATDRYRAGWDVLWGAEKDEAAPG